MSTYPLRPLGAWVGCFVLTSSSIMLLPRVSLFGLIALIAVPLGMLSGAHYTLHADDIVKKLRGLLQKLFPASRQLSEKYFANRYFTVTSSSGRTINRPGFISILLALQSLFIPALCLAAVPFGYLPGEFLLLAWPIVKASVLAQDFQESRTPDIDLSPAFLRLGVLASVVSLIAVYLSSVVQ